MLLGAIIIVAIVLLLSPVSVDIVAVVMFDVDIVAVVMFEVLSQVIIDIGKERLAGQLTIERNNLLGNRESPSIFCHGTLQLPASNIECLISC